MITPHSYVLLMRWRMGEYQALMHLDEAQKDYLVPLVELLKPGFDFEERKPKKTIDAHLEKFGERIASKWGFRPALVDAGRIEAETRMGDGRHPLRFVIDQAHARLVPTIPVTTLNRDAAYQQAVSESARLVGRGAALRCSLDEAFTLDETLPELLAAIALGIADLDIILDLEAPSYEDQDGLAAAVAAALQASELIERSRSTTVLASSFPLMSEVKRPIDVRPRQEWQLFKALRAIWPKTRRPPAYGDYGIDNISVTEGDMRRIKASANVRYTTHDDWVIAKGANTRDNGFAQYRTLCENVSSSGRFLGGGFSPGSGYIDGCRKGDTGTGNQSTWKWVGTNHHITKVVHDLAILHES